MICSRGDEADGASRDGVEGLSAILGNLHGLVGINRLRQPVPDSRDRSIPDLAKVISAPNINHPIFRQGHAVSGSCCNRDDFLVASPGSEGSLKNLISCGVGLSAVVADGPSPSWP